MRIGCGKLGKCIEAQEPEPLSFLEHLSNRTTSLLANVRKR